MNSDPLKSVCDAITARLEETRDRICGEIGAHPRPVHGCDVHFNRLLEDRTKIYQELGRWEALRRNGVASEMIREFVASSGFIDEDARRKFGASLAKRP